MERLHTELLMVPELGPKLLQGLISTLPWGVPSPPPRASTSSHRLPGAGANVPSALGACSSPTAAGGQAVPSSHDMSAATGTAGAAQALGTDAHVDSCEAGVCDEGEGEHGSTGAQRLRVAEQQGLCARASDVVLLACAHSAATASAVADPAVVQALVVEGQVGTGVPLVALQAMAASCRCVEGREGW
eukprot:1158907-Pelagomonas_calceolata.AAC.1